MSRKSQSDTSLQNVVRLFLSPHSKKIDWDAEKERERAGKTTAEEGGELCLFPSQTQQRTMHILTPTHISSHKGIRRIFSSLEQMFFLSFFFLPTAVKQCLLWHWLRVEGRGNRIRNELLR